MTAMTDLTVLVGELSKLEAAATKGPWRTGSMADTALAHVVDMGPPFKSPYAVCHSDDDSSEANAALIVALRNALPALLSAIEQQQAMREALEAIVADADETSLPEEAWAERIAWIDTELAAEPSRSMYGTEDEPARRNGYEVTELVRERAELIARAALRATEGGLDDRL